MNIKKVDFVDFLKLVALFVGLILLGFLVFLKLKAEWKEASQKVHQKQHLELIQKAKESQDPELKKQAVILEAEMNRLKNEKLKQEIQAEISKIRAEQKPKETP